MAIAQPLLPTLSYTKAKSPAPTARSTRAWLSLRTAPTVSPTETSTKDSAAAAPKTGKFEAVQSKDAKGFKLVIAQDDVRYFLQKNDSTLSLVGDSTLTPAASGMNYDLKLKK